MTLDEQILAQHRAALVEKQAAVAKLAGHLRFSVGRLAYPLDSLDTLDPVSLESVSALIERFGKLQDLLGGTFREILLLAGEDASDMARVLARMEKLSLLPSAERWRAMRALRNMGTHEYAPDDSGRTRFVNAVAADVPELLAIADRVAAYASR